ncbi:condensin-2 complex subunit H2-like isoform X2 [Homarus americanus]|nr:condensin-2 complex subunit H2-like isoform X2 [Homarus americanus]XP_042212255.1 condensin-2 complex subunit H2-like isoform X2 [Homarus americanus]
MPQISSSQDLDARFSVFLNPIRDLTKNWEVDIAKYLEEYLEELAEVQITFDGGETLMNFAEAAMLIQGSATVYSKKVEFLWQMVLQMLDLLSSRRNLESGVGDVGGKDIGGGRAVLDHSVDFTTVDKMGRGKNIDLRDDEEEEEMDDCRKRSFKSRHLDNGMVTSSDGASIIQLKCAYLYRLKRRFLPATPLHLVEKDGEKSLHRVSLMMKNSEVFGAKDDFRINRSYLTPKGMLCMEVPSDILRNAALRILDSPVPENTDGENAETGGKETAPVTEAPPQQDVPPDAEEDINNDDGAADLPDDLDTPEDVQQPMNEGKDCEKKDDPKNNNNNLNVIDLPTDRLRKRGGPVTEAVTTLTLTDKWNPINPHAETPAKRPIRAGRLRKPLPCACHLHTQSVSHRKSAKNGKKEKNKKNAQILTSIESHITKEITGIIGSSTKNCKASQELIEEVNNEVANRLELGKCKRVNNLLREGKAFNVEEALQKVLEDTELQQRMEEQLDDPLGSDGAADLDGDVDDLPAPPLFLPEPHDNTRGPECITKRLSDNTFDEPASDYEALVQKWVADYITNAQEHVTSSALVKHVNKWREAILPKLAEEECRKEFDIHKYGSQVLSHFPDNGRKQTISFSEVIKGQDAREVSRHFLSCLMLANTYNIELSETEPGDLAMDCLELTLLSRVRHHEELEEYAAPSQASPLPRKGRTKAKFQSNSQLDNPGVYSGEPTPICADITHITLGDNVQHKSKKPSKGSIKMKR